MKTAKPRGRPIDIDAGYKRVMRRFPVIIAALAALSGCAHVRYVSVPCLTKEQLAERQKSEPPKIHDQLTGDASKDIKPIAGSAVELRAWGRGNLGILSGCVG